MTRTELMKELKARNIPFAMSMKNAELEALLQETPSTEVQAEPAVPEEAPAGPVQKTEPVEKVPQYYKIPKAPFDEMVHALVHGKQQTLRFFTGQAFISQIQKLFNVADYEEADKLVNEMIAAHNKRSENGD